LRCAAAKRLATELSQQVRTGVTTTEAQARAAGAQVAQTFAQAAQ
jgi:hypothetical protein